MRAVTESNSSTRRTEPVWLTGCGDTPAAGPVYRSWREYAEKVPTGSIYLHPDLVLSSPENADGTPSIYARLAQRAEGPDALGCLAVLAPKTLRTPLLPGLPWSLALRGQRLVGNQLLGDDRGEFARAFIEDLIGWMGSRRTDTEFVLFEDLEVGSPLWAALANGGKDRRVTVCYPSQPQPHSWIRFPKNPADYWQQFSGKTRSTLRRKAKKLEHTLICVTRADQVADFLQKAHHISVRSWQAKRLGVRIHNNPQERSFFEFLASQGALRSYLLEERETALAFLVGIQWKGCFVFEETGYDSAVAEFAPGTVLFFRLLEDLTSRNTPRLFDFGFGDGEHKRLFANHQTISGPVLLVRRKFRPLVAMGCDRARQAVSRGFRVALEALRVRTWFRRLYRR